MTTATAGPGRPSLARTRRQEAISAFLGLIAERGLDAVTLDDVAQRAGMQRSVIRHYVGNRGDLVDAAIDALVDDYRQTVVTAVGEHPTLDALIDYLFSEAWIDGQSVADRALTVMFHEATRSDSTRSRLRRAYESLIGVVTDAILREADDRRTPVPADRAAATAYALVCLAEQNVDLQAVGFDRSHSRAAHAAARTVVHTLLSSAAGVDR